MMKVGLLDDLSLRNQGSPTIGPQHPAEFPEQRRGVGGQQSLSRDNASPWWVADDPIDRGVAEWQTTGIGSHEVETPAGLTQIGQRVIENLSIQISSDGPDRGLQPGGFDRNGPDSAAWIQHGRALLN